MKMSSNLKNIWMDYNLENNSGHKEQPELQITKIKIENNSYKCGEIVFLNGNIVIYCSYCDEIYNCFQSFTQHLYEHHLKEIEQFYNQHEYNNTEGLDGLTISSASDSIKINKEESTNEKSFYNYYNDVQLETDFLEQQTFLQVEKLEDIDIPKNEDQSTTNSEDCCNSYTYYEIDVNPQFQDEINETIIEETTDDNALTDQLNLNYKTLLDYQSVNSKKKVKTTSISAASTKQNNNYQCPDCDRNYNRFESLKIHFRSHTGELNPYKCSDCNKTFTAPCKLEVHKRVHSGERPYSCHICPQAFKAKQKLNNHLESHRKGTIKIHSTPIEGISGQERQPARLPILIQNKFVTSLETKKEDGLYHCPLCDRSYRRFESLKEHSENHIGIKQYECYHCNKRFHKFRSLKIHIKSHLPKTNTRWKSAVAITCDYCEKTFNNKYYLNEHFNAIHSGIKQFKCHICLREFAFKNNYMLHMRIHSNDKRYECNYCDRKFIQSCTKTRHERMVHLNKKKMRPNRKNKSNITGVSIPEIKGPEPIIENILQCNEDISNGKLLNINEVNFICSECSSYFENHEEFIAHCQEHETTENCIIEYIDEDGIV